MNILEIMNVPYYKEGDTIHIKKENRGKFTRSAKEHNMGVLEFATHVLNNKDEYDATLVKRANFAKNSKKFKHAKGGLLVCKFQNSGTINPITGRPSIIHNNPNIHPEREPLTEKEKETIELQKQELKKKAAYLIKKTAHLINNHGKKIHNRSKLGSLGYDEAIQDIALSLWRLGNKKGKNYREHYNNIKNEINNRPENRISTSNAQMAAGLSLMGSGISAIGFPIIGSIMSVPDVVYDWAAAIDEPSVENTIHVGTDHLESLSKITPTKYDDFVAKGARIIGNLDDITSLKDEN